MNNSPMTTREGSPRAALLNQAASQSQVNAHINPLSFVRPAMNNSAAGMQAGVMTFGPANQRVAQQNGVGRNAALLQLVQRLMLMQRGNMTA